MGKLVQVGELARTDKVDAVIVGGDLFDRPIVNIQMLVDLTTIIRESGVQWISVVGNHDVVGGSVGNLMSTSLGLLHKFEILSTDDAWTFFDKVRLRLFHYEPGIDLRREYVVEAEEHHAVVVAAHGMIVPRRGPFDHVLIEDVETNADVFLCSHWHPGWGVVESRGTLFCHPGALARMSTSVEERSRRPSVLLVSIDDLAITVQELGIDHGQFEEVFDVRGSVMSKRWGKDVDRFLRAMESAVVGGQTLEGRVESLRGEVEDDLVDYVIGRIREGVKDGE